MAAVGNTSRDTQNVAMTSVVMELYLCQTLGEGRTGFQAHRSSKYKAMIKIGLGDFPGGTVVKNLPANAGDTCSSPGPGRSHMPRSN